MKRSFIATLVVATALAAALLGFRLIQSGSGSPVYAQGLTVSLDMDVTNGSPAAPCAIIDATANNDCGSTYKIGLCATGLYNGALYAIGSFSFDVLYDDTKNTGTEKANVAPALDDNPDANEGTTEWGDGLGGFTCDNATLAYPMGDRNILETGPGKGDAFIACDSLAGPYTMGDNETAGVIAVIEFTAAACTTDQTDNLVIADTGYLAYSDASKMGTCLDGDDYPMPCTGGTDNKIAPPTATPTNTPTNTPTPTLTPTISPLVPECDMVDIGMTANPAVVNMTVNDVATIALQEKIQNQGHRNVGHPDCLLGYAQVGWYIRDGVGAPLDRTKLNPRLEPDGGSTTDYLDGDGCIAGIPPLYSFLPCDEEQSTPPVSPYVLSNHTGGCVNGLDDEVDGTCDWGPVNAACVAAGSPDPQCVDVDGMLIKPLVMIAGVQMLPTGGIYTIDRNLDIHCKKPGTYTVKAIGNHLLPRQCHDNLDNDVDGAFGDGCTAVGAVETVCNETACPDADSQAPWDTCDNDADGIINDGCVTVGASKESSWPYGMDPDLTNDQSAVNITVNCTVLPAEMVKDCDPDTEGIQTNCNLWLMDPEYPGGTEPDGTVLPPADENGCVLPELGKGCLAVDVWLFNAQDVDNPNDGDTVAECLGAWEHQVKYEHKILRFADDLLPGDPPWIESTGRVANCTYSVLTENYMYESCITMDGPAPGIQNGPCGNGIIEKMLIIPLTDDMIYRDGFRPTKDNGVVTDILDENCEITDIYAEPMLGLLPGGLTPICGDIHITIRMLQGDLDLDCDVDVVDEMSVAFRYGSFWGLQLYDQWFDLEPKYTDYDIDIKDLQFVFGRDSSTCQEPIPDDQAVPVEPPQP